MYCFIINRVSGNGRALKVWHRIESILQEKKIAYRALFTQKPNHATALVHELVKKQEAKAIIALGGDGTVHEVLNGLIGSTIPLGVIPAGSGNDFCRGMGIPLKYDKALQRILKGEQKVIDVGHINSKYFATVVGIGFDGQVAKETNKSQNKKILNRVGMGSISYIIGVLKVLFYFKPTSVDIKIDSNLFKHQKLWLIAVANSPSYAGGMKICPHAISNDQLFDICIVQGMSKWELLRVFPSVFKGKHISHPSITTLKGREIEIFSDSPMPVHGDGEIIGETPVKIKIMPSTISVL